MGALRVIPNPSSHKRGYLTRVVHHEMGDQRIFPPEVSHKPPQVYKCSVKQDKILNIDMPDNLLNG